MKKKMFALLTAMLCLTAPISAVAADIEIEADDEVQYVYEASTFTYKSNNTLGNRTGFYLESDIAQPEAMVVGHIYAPEWAENYEPGELAGYIVTPINESRLLKYGTSMLRGSIAKECISDQQLEVGDLLDFEGAVSYSRECFPVTDPELSEAAGAGEIKYIGNGVDMFGEEFEKVLRLQLVIDQTNLEADKKAWVERYNVDLVKGDVTVDDSVNILDSIQINKAVMAGAELCDYAKLAGDVNENGAIDADDSLMILKETIGLTENFE